MKKIILSILSIAILSLIVKTLYGSSNIAESVSQYLEYVLTPFVSFLAFIFLGADYDIFSKVRNINIFGLPLLVFWLIVGGVFFTFKLRFINVRLFKHAIDIARGQYVEKDAPGKVTQLQALFTAVAATVGLGNIAGVAIAISIGGPGAVIWMMIAAFFAMTLKCAEVILGQKYRKFNKDGHLLAGAFYYLEDGLKEKGMMKMGKLLAVLAAVLCIGGVIGGGLMFQANQSVAIIADSFSMGSVAKLLLVLALTALVGVIIIGGISRIASFTEKVVPLMAILYVLSCLIVLIMNYDNILAAVSLMFSSAFQGDAVYGGVIGAVIQGVKRSAFSNEAGIGSAPIAHAAGRTREPVREGTISLLEPFIDTIVICFMTGIVLVVTGVYQEGASDGVLMTRDAFATVAPWFSYILSVMVFLFAFSTMLTYTFYGQQAWLYLTKGKGFIACQLVSLSSIFIGGMINLGIVIDLADILFLSMAIPNLIGMYIMSNVIKSEVVSYMDRLRNGKFEALRKENMSKK